MWQPPGGLSDPPAINGEDEMSDEQEPMTSVHSFVQHSNSQDTGSQAHNPPVARDTRTVVTSKREPCRRTEDHQNATLYRASTSTESHVSQNGYSCIIKQRGSVEDLERCHLTMTNVYGVQYSPPNLLSSTPDGVIPNECGEEDTPRRLSNKRQHRDSANSPIPVSDEQPNDHLNLWAFHHDHFSNYNAGFNRISSYSRPERRAAGTSQCSTSDFPAQSLTPNLFNGHIDNTTSISDYSTLIGNNTMSCVNPSTSIAGYILPESVGVTVASSILENSDSSSVSSETSSSEIMSSNIYEIDRSFGKRLATDENSEMLVKLNQLLGSNLNLPPSTVQARKVANRVISHTRMYKTPDERAIWCLNCDRVPIAPVTGQCGHTRCSACVKETNECPCGISLTGFPFVNTVIQGIIDKMLQHDSANRVRVNSTTVLSEAYRRKYRSLSSASAIVATKRPLCPRLRRAPIGFISTKKSISLAGSSDGRMPITPQARFKRARDLLVRGRYREAAPHLARVAASSASYARVARTLLAQAISALCENVDPRLLTRDLFRDVRLQSAMSWLKAADLECVLCYHTYTNPVTTPCGHTYCRTCIERSLDYKKFCPLCLRSLEDFNLAATNETEFVNAILVAIDAVVSPSPPDPDIIPIFVCTVAFPSIPCPLFIFDPRYWMMIRRILESGSRKFGMVAYERDRFYSDYGTVLEVCDCVHLEDGRSILSTVGVSRFRVIERDVRDGCDVARIQPLIDVTPIPTMVWELRVVSTQVLYKTLLWLERMNRAVRAEIEAAFGPVPQYGQPDEEWWEYADGPQWLWWVIAILPLRSEIKVLILSTRHLLKRLMAVSRTLEAMNSEAFTNNRNNECDLGTALSSTEEWLERNA